VEIAKASGLVPSIPEWLKKSAGRDLLSFTMAFFAFLSKNPKAAKSASFVLAETLGKKYDSANLAALWGILLMMPAASRKNAARAGFKTGSALSVFLHPIRILKALGAVIRYRSIAPLMALSPVISQSLKIHEELMKHPEGIWIGKLDFENNMKELKTSDKKINAYIPEFEDQINKIDAESERKALTPDPAFPLILNAGRHTRNNANTLMRDPAWLKGKRGCAIAINPADASPLGIKDGDNVRVITEAGEASVEAEVTEDVRKGSVLIPHGFGLNHEGKEYGINVNRLTKNTHREDFTGTPLHRYVPCRVEKV
jgi:anaerobic selenocysteine-containing dehydrogenase